MNITTKASKWGNGTGVRLPQKVVKAANLKPDQQLAVTMKGRSVILTPVADEDFTLDDMLRGVTPEKIHPEVSWGQDAGAEVIG